MMEEDFRYTIKKHVAITAGAGSGKTYTLSRRYVNALLGFDFFTQTNPDVPKSVEDAKKLAALPIEIVTTTFTEAGAMEMRGRIEELIFLMIRILEDPQIEFDKKEQKEKFEIKERLEFLSSEFKDYILERLQDSLESIHLSIISTIHTFALSIIKQNIDLIPMDTSIDILDDTTKEEIFDAIWFDVINKNDTLFLELDSVYSVFNIKSFASRYTFDSRIRDGFDAFVQSTQNNTTLSEIYLKLFFEENIEKIIKAFEAYENSDKSKNEIEAVFKEYLDGVFSLNPYRLTYLTGKSIQKEKYGPLRDLFDKTAVFKQEAEELFRDTLKKIHTIIKDIRDAYVIKLKEDGRLDFDRILEVANNLTQNEDATLKTYKFFFIDEFQDTNYLQWSLIKNAAKFQSDNSANIFLVGDEKQSIFEFQGAEVSTFQTAIDEIKKQKGDDSIKTPQMMTNYRSDQNIIDFVNSIFEKTMIKDLFLPSKPSFKDSRLQKFIDKVYNHYLEGSNREHEVHYISLNSASDNDGTVRVLVKETPKLYKDTKAKKLEKYNTNTIALHEANMIAYFINEIKEGRYPEYEDITQNIQENKKAIAILCDAKKHMLMIKDALKKYGLESKVSASEDFYSSMEIKDIFYILAMCCYLQKDQDISLQYIKQDDPQAQVKEKQNVLNQQKRFFLVGALRSNILRYSDDEIMDIVNQNKIPQNVLELISLQNVFSLADFISYIIQRYELKRVYAHFDDYAQRKANLKKIVEMAKSFQALYKTTLVEFVEMLEKRILGENKAKEDQAFYESNQTNIIEIRTMHSSKGLAWPMVIVPELGGDLKGKSPSLNYASYTTPTSRLDFVGFSIDKNPNISNEIAKVVSNQKKYAEKKRLLYVAMTRPQNHLVLTVAKNDKTTINSNSYWGRWLQDVDIQNKDECSESEIKQNQFLSSKKVFKNSYIDVELYETKLPKDVVKPSDTEELKELKENILEIATATIQPKESGNDEDVQIENVFEKKPAAEFGVLAHLVLELGYKIFTTSQEASFIDEFIQKYEVEDKIRLKSVVENFKKSVVFKEILKADLVVFEQEYNFFDKEKNYNQLRIIDLLYFYDGRWNIIDFKSNSLSSRTKDEIIKEHGYQEQLDGYYEYVAKIYGVENINRCEILWLEDGSLSDMRRGAK